MKANSIERGVARARIKRGGPNPAARRLAQRMLRAGEPRADVAAALVLAFGFNTAKATRLVSMVVDRNA